MPKSKDRRKGRDATSLSSDRTKSQTTYPQHQTSAPPNKPKTSIQKFVNIKGSDIEVRFLASSATPKSWWELWQETEHLKFYQSNPVLSYTDRIYEATIEFNRDRTWPPQQTQVRALWDRFQVYLGTLINAAGNEETRLQIFVEDPGRFIQVYLSSYFAKSGMQGSEYKIVALCRLLTFYVNFLLRNHVLPEVEYEDNLKNALKIIDLAKTELLLVMESAKALPDEWNLACKDHFTRNRAGLKVETDDTTKVVESNQSDQVKTGLDDHAVPKTEDVEQPLNGESGGWGDTSSSGWGSLSNVEVKSEEIAGDDWSTSSGWGTGWGAGGTSQSGDMDTDPWSAWSSGATAQDQEAKPAWTPPEPPSLQKFIGPTAFPLTHSAGIAEWSVRRIKSIDLPLPRTINDAKEDDQDSDVVGESAAAVAIERKIESTLWKVVLTPWPISEWSSSRLEVELVNEMPRILKTSVGKVVPDGGVIVEDESDIETYTGPLKPHDPLHDDIVIFVEEASMKSIKPGMGLGGTWVQLLRNADLEDNAEGVLKTTDDEPFETRFWFMDQLLLTLTSYHTV
ncbi:hypothetical protein D9758_004434 [Tetrapyrgos nigripes]|uniref:Uncharacterized protein n=1 Tax=Tetrapyrgos nigripes TaxID=182062 RepID=A0A8H5GN60_9AGAR|nr:hypothetical protein D9758_004434 [Tetrapyrgos nigripes]